MAVSNHKSHSEPLGWIKKPSARYLHILEQLYQSKNEKRDLSRVLKVRELLESPDQNYRTIHVAGTNGKGSVCTKIAKAFTLNGYRTGLFTSPHLFDFTERIKVDENPIDEEEIIQRAEKLFSLNYQLGLNLTFFEYTTLIALDYFKDEKVDIAIIEVGLGGTFDATNIITPILSVITSISLDHTELLGNTVEKIAAEKAGIIKQGVPVVVGPKAAFSPIFQKAQEKKCPLIEVKGHFSYFDDENSAIAKTTLEQLGLDSFSIEKAVRFKPPCRFDVRSSGQIILDGAHNPDAFMHLLEAIQEKYPEKSLKIVFGISKDKDWKSSLNILLKKAKYIHLTESSSSRATPTHLLATHLFSQGFDQFSEDQEVAKAIEKALPLLEGELLVICGSFYLMRKSLITLSN